MLISEIITVEQTSNVFSPIEDTLRRHGFQRQGGPTGMGTVLQDKKGRVFTYKMHPFGDKMLWWRLENQQGAEIAKGTNMQDFTQWYIGIREAAMGGSTSAGSIASVANPTRGLSRRPSIFGYVQTRKKPKKKKKSKKQ